MKTKHLLTGLVLPALFAACTAEEIESSKGVMTQEDLSARPSVGNVVLNFGDINSRAELGDNAFNSIEFNANEDAIGARIIDTYSAEGLKDANGERVAWSHYDIVNEYASSNYQYVYNGEGWETTALMVEGNYMFYYPYNAKNVARGPLEIITPTHQTVKPNEKDGDRNPIAELYAGENPAFVGYKFIDAEDQDLTISVDMQHVFAYPQITLVNEFETKNKKGDEVETDLTITKIVLSSDAIFEKYTVNHADFRDNLTPEFTYLKKATDKKETILIEAGDWTEAESLLKSATIATIAKASEKTVEITVEFEDGLELAYGEEYAFNVVLPASAYEAGDLTMKVYTEDDMMIGVVTGNSEDVAYFSNSKKMTFAPGKRYSTQEYNFPANGNPAPKKTAGNSAVYELGDENLALIDAVAPVAVINDIKEFEAFLETIGRNVETLQEITKESERNANADNFILAPALDEKGEKLGYANLAIDEAFLALLDEYNYDGKIKFVSTMIVKGAEEAPNAAEEIEEMTLGNKDYSMEFAEAIVTEGYVTANEYTKATNVEVKAGVLTIADSDCEDDEASAELSTVVVKGGEAIVTDPCFNVSSIIAGYAPNAGETAIATTGKVTLDYEGETNAPAVQGGELIIGADVVIKSTPNWTDAKVGTDSRQGRITNNGEIKSNLTVNSGVVLTNNGKFTKNTNINKGTIIANTDMTIKINTGKITVGDDLVEVTVTDDTETNLGDIDNTEGGKVYAEDNQNVYAILTSLVDNGDEKEEKVLSQKYDYYSGIDKYVLTGEWKVKSANVKLEQVVYDPTETRAAKRSFEFAAGSSLNVSAGASLYFTHDVIISSNVSWTGREVNGSFLYLYDQQVDTDEVANDIVFKKNSDGVFYNVVVKNLTTDVNPQEYLLRDALAEGGTAKINNNVVLKSGDSPLTMSKNVTTMLDLNGKTVQNDYSDVFVVEAGNLTLKGNGNVIAASTNTASACAVWVKGDANTAVTIENGTYKVGGDSSNSEGNVRNDLIYVGASESPALGGTVTINGGYFEYTGEKHASDYMKDGNYWLLNCNDKSYLYKNARIVVKGGTFHNFNPKYNYAESKEGITSFLAENYTVKSYKAGTTVEEGEATDNVAYETSWSTQVDYKVIAE